MRARRDAALRLLKIMMVASIVIPATIFSYASWVAYHSAFDHADEQLVATMHVMSEQAVSVFQSVDLTFTSVDAISGDLSDEEIKASEQKLHLQLSKLEKALSAVDGILVADKDGHTLVSSAIYPVRADRGIVDRNYFIAQKERDAGTFISAVLKPRVRTEPFFAVSRRRPLRDGAFTGVVMVAVLPKEFSDFYSQLAGNTGASFSLIKADGAILARHPAPPGDITRFGPNSGFIRSVAAQPEGGIVTDISVDGFERRIGYRKLGYADLYVSDGLPTDAIFAAWRQTMIAASLLRRSGHAVSVRPGDSDQTPDAGVLCRGRAARTRRAGAAAIAEDGSGRPVDRRRRARLQQSADHHHRQSRHRQARRGRGPRRARAGQRADRRRARGAADPAPAGVLAAAAAQSAGGRCQPVDRQHVRHFDALARRDYRAGDDQRRRALEDRGRRFRTGIGAAQSGDQRARRHAEGRQAHHRDQQRLSGR